MPEFHHTGRTMLGIDAGSALTDSHTMGGHSRDIAASGGVYTSVIYAE
jgi:hypothetical protein